MFHFQFPSRYANTGKASRKYYATVADSIAKNNSANFVDNNDINKKLKLIQIYFNNNELYNLKIFISKLDLLQSNTRYSILFRVCFGTHPTYKMLGRQLGFFITDISTKIYDFENLQDNITKRLESSMTEYRYTGDDVNSVQLLIYKVYYTDNIIKSLDNVFSLNSLGEKKDLVDITNKSSDLGFNKLLPSTMNLSHYLNTVPVKTENGLIKSIFINENWIDFACSITQKSKIINKHTLITQLNENFSIFTDKKNKYILVLEKEVVNSFLQHKINIYTRDGLLVLNVVDRTINHTSFSRTIGNITNIIDNNRIITNTKINIKLDSIKPNKSAYALKNLYVNNPYIGTLDIETYSDNGVSRVYALGFYTKQHNVNIFYINPNTLNSDQSIIDCIDSMLTSKYTGYTFYVHNLGRYDAVFLLSVLITANMIDDRYILDMICRDDTILSLSISKKVNKKMYTIKIIDSYNILSHSLKTLCLTFNTKISKDIFPYKFLERNILFYTGVKPFLSFFEDVEFNIYNQIPMMDWNSQTETIKYLEKDLISLYQVINKFSDYIYLKYKVQVSTALTISSLAMKVFLTKYNKNNLPLINKISIYEDIKKKLFWWYNRGLYTLWRRSLLLWCKFVVSICCIKLHARN